jgi:hypothetical protein
MVKTTELKILKIRSLKISYRLSAIGYQKQIVTG